MTKRKKTRKKKFKKIIGQSEGFLPFLETK